jgi:hypothetical protein
VIVVGAAIGMLSVAYVYLEPFATRYEGATARQWFKRWMKEPDLRADVVDAFGTNAVPLLGQQLKSYARAYDWSIAAPAPIKKLIVDFYLHSGERQQLATDWLTFLDARGHTVIPMLNEMGLTNTTITILCFHSPEDLDRLLTRDSSEIVKAEVEAAKLYIRRTGQLNTNRLMSLKL